MADDADLLAVIDHFDQDPFEQQANKGLALLLGGALPDARQIARLVPQHGDLGLRSMPAAGHVGNVHNLPAPVPARPAPVPIPARACAPPACPRVQWHRTAAAPAQPARRPAPDDVATAPPALRARAAIRPPPARSPPAPPAPVPQEQAFPPGHPVAPPSVSGKSVPRSHRPCVRSGSGDMHHRLYSPVLRYHTQTASPTNQYARK